MPSSVSRTLFPERLSNGCCLRLSSSSVFGDDDDDKGKFAAQSKQHATQANGENRGNAPRNPNIWTDVCIKFVRMPRI
jgi:hypothetical protein